MMENQKNDLSFKIGFFLITSDMSETLVKEVNSANMKVRGGNAEHSKSPPPLLMEQLMDIANGKNQAKPNIKIKNNIIINLRINFIFI